MLSSINATYGLSLVIERAKFRKDIGAKEFVDTIFRHYIHFAAELAFEFVLHRKIFKTEWALEVYNHIDIAIRARLTTGEGAENARALHPVLFKYGFCLLCDFSYGWLHAQIIPHNVITTRVPQLNRPRAFSWISLFLICLAGRLRRPAHVIGDF